MVDFISFSLLIDYLFSPISIFILSLAFLSIVLIVHDKREGYFFSSVLVITGVLIWVVKNLVDKARPTEMLVLQEGFAFPSGHTAISLVFFVSLAHLFSKNKPRLQKVLFYSIAGALSILVGFTRIYLKVHDYYDVLGGFLLGGIVLSIGIWFYEKRLS